MSGGLSIDSVGQRFGATRALHDVSLEIEADSIHALIGENGAGKSTLVKILSGVLSPDEGTMRLHGQPFHPDGPNPARHAGVATVHQELSLAGHLTVAENLFLGHEPTRFGQLDRHQMATDTRNALARLQREDISGDALIRDLPIADRQLVEIARALQGSATVLILDEPTSSLTGEDADRLFAILRRLREEGMAILYISHFLEEILDLTDVFTVLRDGEVTAHGVTAETDATALATQMVGRPLQARSTRRSATGTETLLEVDQLEGDPLPLEAEIQLHRGEILGIGGLVGSGRSELVRTIFGLQPVVEGRVQILDLPGPLTPAACLTAGLGLLSEDRAAEGLALSLSVADNILMSRWPQSPAGWLDREAGEQAAARWVKDLSIRCESIHTPVQQLSGGNQQKVALARLLHHDVEVLLLDEPTRGVDIASKQTIYECVEQLADAGKAVLVTSSHLPELLGLCDRIAIMHRGRLGPFRHASQRTEHDMILEATLGSPAGGAL